ncbi:hypothetical protein HWD99_04395 [Microbacterium sp. C5A9]|uniref:hypothetical protein n=1 Tax=Microbacterium sp. C5A9 TaxID=2736663 RepID=UPI001F523AD7|nr:hypothetical protein [Microbacterium sp. C5A9]MCI1017859.1 hypothetical protein [Microbacterium sp. C5A9]
MVELIFQYVLPGAIVSLLGRWFLLAGKRRDRGASEAAAEAARHEKQFPGWQELVDENRRLRADLTATDEKLSAIEKQLSDVRKEDTRKMQAVARILRALFDQWPGGDTPNLGPADIAEIEDTIPPEWVRRRAV